MTGNQRFELMPELPTMEQAGLKGFEVNNWYALFAPAGTSKDIVARLNTEVVKILALAVVLAACCSCRSTSLQPEAAISSGTPLTGIPPAVINSNN